jgi:hypothetical protein
MDTVPVDASLIQVSHVSHISSAVEGTRNQKSGFRNTDSLRREERKPKDADCMEKDATIDDGGTSVWIYGYSMDTGTVVYSLVYSQATK